MGADGWEGDWSLGTLIDGVVALALTFAIAHYGLGALFATSRAKSTIPAMPLMSTRGDVQP